MIKKQFVFLLGCMFFGDAVAVPARVGYVIDGDTFAAIVNLDPDVEISVRVRLRNVDTPEINGECEYERARAAAAKVHLAKIIPTGATVQLENIKDDKYLGRIDANVFDADGNDVGDVMIKDGFGRRYSGGRRQPWCDISKK
ncbi:MAG: thermonuclease family protein [Alphaproteobacteria bacterium]|nr:thermonuclease family protein [Alphaproteobacteria bacterium]